MTGFIQSIVDANKKAWEQLEVDAKVGNISGVQSFFANKRIHNDQQASRQIVLDTLMENPNDFARPCDLFEVLTRKDFDFEQFIIRDKAAVTVAVVGGALRQVDNKSYDEKDIWNLYAKDARPETAKLAAILAAELMRIRICQGKDAMPDLQGLISADKGLTAETKKASIRDSVIATQNALVDYIREEGRTLPLNRGGGFLIVAMDDSSQELRDFLTRKMTDAPLKTKYSIKEGDIAYAAPVYEGPQ